MLRALGEIHVITSDLVVLMDLQPLVWQCGEVARYKRAFGENRPFFCCYFARFFCDF